MNTRHGLRGRSNWIRLLAVGAAFCLRPGEIVQAHPMGNFAICHYTRLQAERGQIRLRYILDLAEIPTVGEKRALDGDGDGVVSAAEEQAFLAAQAPRLLAGLTLRVNDRLVPLRQVGGAAALSPGAGGLETLRIRLDLYAPLSPAEAPYRVVFRDRNYEERTGWKEILAVGGATMTVRDSSVPAADRSQELTAYPPDLIPPQDTEAHFTTVFDPKGDAIASAASADAGNAGASSSATPRDAFTQLIASRELAPGLVVIGLLTALTFGALHALSPGHGKAMVAAYLVGARGTARHAVFLGLIVTITHTFGVFLLGLIALLASRYVVPERLYPLLGVVSGALILGVGARLLYHRIRRLLRGDAPRKSTATPHHHDLPLGPVTARTLIALGVSGGIVPCPSALVVLLAAIALHRIAYGLLLISAFSCGLGAVLVGIGLLVVYARNRLDRFSVSRALLRRIPVASAAVITLIGAALIVRAVGQGIP
jgi:ABC-type nickel/cobalt efflux system permease component RcnA